MKFWLVVLGLLRSRRVASTVAATSLTAAALGFFLVPAHYTSTATLVLTTSPTNQAATGGDPNSQPAINPLLNFNEGLKTAGSIVIQALNTKEAIARLDADSGSTSVTISMTGGAQQLGVNGPFVYISGDSTDSPEQARAIVRRAKDLASEVLAERQTALKAPVSQLIGLLFVVEPTEPVIDRSSSYKAAATGCVLAISATLAFFYFTEITRRGRRGEIQPIGPGDDDADAFSLAPIGTAEPESEQSDDAQPQPSAPSPAAPEPAAPALPGVLPSVPPRRRRPRPMLRSPLDPSQPRNGDGSGTFADSAGSSTNGSVAVTAEDRDGADAPSPPAPPAPPESGQAETSGPEE